MPTRHEFVEAVERAVLTALDKVAYEAFQQERSGWTDGELPALMPAVHSHAKKMYRRLTIHTSE